MSHLYNAPIAVTLVAGRPAALRWRGVAYRVLACSEPWRLLDRRWGRPDAPGAGAGRSDRTYYRLHCAPQAPEAPGGSDLTCEVYHEGGEESEGATWILERVYD